MKLKEYAKVIAVLAEKYPNAKVIFSIDDEGNAYNEVFYHPTPGHFDNVMEFEPVGDVKKVKVNAICIN